MGTSVVNEDWPKMAVDQLEEMEIVTLFAEGKSPPKPV